jgi:hypothetical protein
LSISTSRSVQFFIVKYENKQLIVSACGDTQTEDET